MKLKDFKEGDVVVLWCEGWGAWDDEYTLIIDVPDVGSTVKVESPKGSGRINRFWGEIEAKRV